MRWRTCFQVVLGACRRHFIFAPSVLPATGEQRAAWTACLQAINACIHNGKRSREGKP